MTLHFFDSVYHTNRKSMSWADRVFEAADSYFALPGTKKVRVLSGCIRNGAQGVVEEDYSLSKLNIVLKVASLFTVFVIPVAMLLVKFVGRKNRKFYEIKKDDLCEKIAGAAQKNTAAIQIQRKFRTYSKASKAKKDLIALENEKNRIAKEQNQKAAKVFQKVCRGRAARKVFGELRKKRNQEYYEQLCGLTKSPSCGSKHDNLLRVRASLDSSGLAFVPPFFGFTNEQIQSCLGVNAKTMWEEICEQNNIDLSKDKLIKLQEQIKKDIVASLVFTDVQKQALLGLTEKRLIVRSSSHEDGSIVNAGGNLTLGNIDAKEQSVKKAIADVVASYFSYVSLKNRSEFEEVFEDMPLCSVLVMEQMMEQPLGSPVVSGVMMTHKPNWSALKEGRIMQISATYGFGEGVVSGSIPSDEWVVTDSIAYATVRKKTHRIRVLSGGGSEQITNEAVLQQKPALTEEMLKKLKAVAVHLEKDFGCALDIEFVVDNEKLYIVQARPIQASEMAKETYLDPDKLPKECTKFLSTPILSGTGQVFSVKPKRLLFAATLEEAISLFKKETYDAVVVHTPPQASNSHAAVNFASYRPPIACFALPKTEWEKCSKLSQTKDFTICSQTGGILALEEGQKVEVCEGLFSHPASSSLSIGAPSKSVQAQSVDADIREINQLLSATPETLLKRIDMISKKVDALFSSILSRKTLTKTMSQLTRTMQESVSKTIEVMKQCKIEQGAHLALHATMLRQMLHQKDAAIVSGHSLAGIRSAIAYPPQIEEFMEKYATQETLLELAALGAKAFNEELQKKWVDFLELYHESPRLEELYRYLQKIDAINMAPMWFSFYLADEIIEDDKRKYKVPTIDSLIQTEELPFLENCAKFDERFHNIKAKIEKSGSQKELEATWNAIAKESEDFLQFRNQQAKTTEFQKIYSDRVLTNLINLWDLHIKTVSTSRFLDKEATDEIVRKRVTQFAQFGQKCLKFLPGDHAELGDLLREIEKPAIYVMRSHFAGIEHWLVPRSRCCGYLENDDQRLSVIHQNLLQAARSQLGTSLLPSRLANGKRIFDKINAKLSAKRYADATGTFVSISEETASVRINIPLNLHSCVVTISQNRKKDAPLTIASYWRASDNYQSAHQDFLLLFAILTGIDVQSTRIPNQKADLEVVFSVKDDREMELVSKAILRVNAMSLYTKDYFKELVLLVCKKSLESSKEESAKEEILKEREAATNKIWGAVWDWFKKRNQLPGVIGSDYVEYPSSGVKKYFLQHQKEILEGVLRELEAGSDGMTPFIQNGFLGLLRHISSDEDEGKVKSAVWNSLVKTQKLHLFYVPKKWREDLFWRLCTEAPSAAHAYCNGDSFNTNWLKPFVEKMRDEAAKTGKKLSEEAQKLIDLVCTSQKKG